MQRWGSQRNSKSRGMDGGGKYGINFLEHCALVLTGPRLTFAGPGAKV